MKNAIRNPIFRNELAKKWYTELAKNSDIYEHGIDTNGKIYFAWLNGKIERYTRKQFLTLCNELEDFANDAELQEGYKKYGM